MGRPGCAGETGRNRVGGYCDPAPPRWCGADHRQTAREGRQADDPRTDHKREQRTEGGPMMKFRSTTIAGVALAVASITALAACSSSNSSSSPSGTSSSGSSSSLGLQGQFGNVPAQATGPQTSGTITVAEPPNSAPTWIL